ncbi:MAG: transposase [Nitrospirota bacterium]|mgnify:FL=1
MPRIARVCAVGYPHHITQRGNNKKTVFFEDEDKEFYLKTLSKYSQKWAFDIWAYCLMPNHVHILAVPRKEESLARGIGSANLVYTQYINRKYNRSGRLWQNRFFFYYNTRKPYLWAVARHIEYNPVRAKLAAKAERYEWSNAKGHILGVEDKILSDKDWLEERDRIAYRRFINKEDKPMEASIRKATTTGRPLGAEGFIKRLEKLLERDILPKKAGRPKKEK